MSGTGPWLPISSAPTDGTVIEGAFLVKTGGGYSAQARDTWFSDGKWRWSGGNWSPKQWRPKA